MEGEITEWHQNLGDFGELVIQGNGSPGSSSPLKSRLIVTLTQIILLPLGT